MQRYRRALCGSRITIDLIMKGWALLIMGKPVRPALGWQQQHLGRLESSGKLSRLRQLRDEMRNMLEGSGVSPAAPFKF